MKKSVFALLLFIRLATSSSSGAPAVFFNEIMFHPTGTNKLEQWFELYNAGSKSVNLTGWKITRGVDFTFPTGSSIAANGYLVVAADGPTFSAAHPGVLNFVAGWTGKLGHHLELSDTAGKVVNEVEFYADGDWATRVIGPVQYNRQGWEWFSLADGLGSSLELINPNLPNSYAHNWVPNVNTNSTPGQRNSSASNDAVPFISGVAHWPPVPKSTDQVFVTVRVADEALGTVSVALNWRVDGSAAFTQTAMLDNGTMQDGIANDGVYGAAIPAQSDRTVVEFFITAADATGHIRVYPSFLQPSDSKRTANLLYQVDNSTYSGTQPLYRMIMTEAERAYLEALGVGCPDSDSDAEMNGTWITTDGVLAGGTGTQVRYNIGVRNRGHGTRQSIPHNFHVNIPSDRLWKGQAGINLNSQYAHSQVIGSAIMRKAGLAMPDSHAVQLRVNGINLIANGGNSFGSYAANEQFNNDFVERVFPLDPDGNSYRGIRQQALCDPSTYSVADLSWHGADWEIPVYTNAYYKQNNFVADDWTDLQKLIAVLNVTNGTTAATYVSDVRKVLNVEEWMRYFATDALIGNGETALANGIGDDYALYRGVFDTRFQVSPYDMDTVMGRGLDSVSPRQGIFRMSALPVLDRLVKSPEFAPLYYRELKNLADTIFSSAQIDPLLDQLLGGFVSANAIENMKAFNASQRDYVLSQIPLSLTVTSTLPQASGYLRASSPTTSLTGGANAIDTRRIVVNGQSANWVAWQGTWSLNNIAIQPGLNRLTVRALGTNDHEVASTTVDIWYDDGTVATAPTSIAADTTWTAAGGPYNAASGITIANGATLKIEPGTTVYLGSGANLTVASGGRLIAEGTEQLPIRFTRAPGSTAAWGGIVVNGGTGSPETRISHAHIEFNGTTAIHTSFGTIALDHLTFGTTSQQYLSLDSSSFVVSYCHFPTPTAGFEPCHGAGGVKSGGHAIFYRNFFGAPTGYNDVFDFTGGQRGQPILYFVQNVMAGSGDDGLDLDGTDAWVEGNIFMHIHQNGAPDSSAAISGGNDAGNTSEVTILGNILFDCDNAATAKQGNFFTLYNNTIVHMTKEGGTDLAAGAVNVRDTTPDLTTFGKGFYLEGNIIQDVEQLVRNNDPSQAPVTFNNNLLPSRWDGAGASNTVSEPLFKHLPSVAEAQFSNWEQAQVMWDWFSLLPGSPGKKSGPGGKDKGGVVPMGVYLSGQPTGTNNQTTATIQVGIDRTGFNIPASGWPNGSGFTAYKWRLDGGAWSAETAIGLPITLNGLATGPHSVDVVGKSDTGLYQDDLLLGDAASVSSTGTWYVDPSAPIAKPTIWINEILARSSSINGFENPDLVEFYNYGTTTVDLSGWHVTDNPSQPFAFTFPTGTTVKPGEYFVVQADSNYSADGLHLGFAMDADGDALYLLDAASRKMDAIQFGRQPNGYSIGRGDDGEWTLCEPSFGEPNRPKQLGDPTKLRINEWLADREFSFSDKFVELYNPNTRPVCLGGLSLSVAASTPNQSPFSPLSYIAPGETAAFIADGKNTPGHLGFELSADVGLISLSSGTGLIDSVQYGPQTTDVSEGRSPNGSDTIVFFNQPTPGAANPGQFEGTTTNVTRSVIAALTLTNSWRYNESGTDLGTTWRESGYNDSAWPSGRALFYHGNAPARMPIPVETTLTFNSTEQTTFYFRTHFNYTGPLSNLTLSLTQIIDDGLVVYLNGNEVFRKNMPSGTISYDTFASSTVSDATQSVANNIPATGILSGDNVVAVEVHQVNRTSTDIAMALGVDVVASETNVVSNGNAPLSVVLNEVFAKNTAVVNPNGTTSDWLELINTGTNGLSLADLSVTDDVTNPRKWVFPAGARIEAQSRMLLYFDNEAPSATNNTGFRLSEEGGTVLLFDSLAHGGSLLDSIRYGMQVPNLTLSRIPDGTGAWTLSSPTPLAQNLAQPLGSAENLRINEWAASVSNGPDWFELFNGDSKPVALGGLFLTDDLTDRVQFRVEPLSFIGTGDDAFVKFIADGDPESGANHVNFNLSANGEEIGLYQADGTPIDSVIFGEQVGNVSQGRLPDGSATILNFPNSSSAGESNYLPLNNVVINEALVNVTGQQQIELFNPTSTTVNLGGWFLSNSRTDLDRFRIADGTSIAPGGFLVLSGTAFQASGLVFDGTNGDSIVLSATAADGSLTGLRTAVKFGPTERGVSVGRVPTSIGADFTAMSSPTLGQINSGPKIGPVVVSEILYASPLQGSVEDPNLEFLELENISNAATPLFDTSVPTNRWALRSAVRFDFPANTTLSPGERILVIGFDPQNSALRAAFINQYGIPQGTRIFGPWSGRLDNSGESVQLVKPGVAVAGSFPPEILVDRVDYSAIPPWPLLNLDNSLQRVASNEYGNDPINWKSDRPTAGQPNSGQVSGDSDADGLADDWELSHFGNLSHDGRADSDGDGLSDYAEFLTGTNPTDPQDLLKIQSVLVNTSNATVQFDGIAGKTYRIEASADPGAATWSLVQEVGPMTASGMVQVVDNNAGSLRARYYRLRLQ